MWRVMGHVIFKLLCPRVYFISVWPRHYANGSRRIFWANFGSFHDFRNGCGRPHPFWVKFYFSFGYIQFDQKWVWSSMPIFEIRKDVKNRPGSSLGLIDIISGFKKYTFIYSLMFTPPLPDDKAPASSICLYLCKWRSRCPLSSLRKFIILWWTVWPALINPSPKWSVIKPWIGC